MSVDFGASISAPEEGQCYRVEENRLYRTAEEGQNVAMLEPLCWNSLSLEISQLRNHLARGWAVIWQGKTAGKAMFCCDVILLTNKKTTMPQNILTLVFITCVIKHECWKYSGPVMIIGGWISISYSLVSNTRHTCCNWHMAEKSLPCRQSAVLSVHYVKSSGKQSISFKCGLSHPIYSDNQASGSNFPVFIWKSVILQHLTHDTSKTVYDCTNHFPGILHKI